MELKLVIRFVPGKGVSVEGPIQDKLICYGLLEAARDAIRDYGHQAAAEPGIAVPSPQLAKQLVGGLNGYAAGK